VVVDRAAGERGADVADGVTFQGRRDVLRGAQRGRRLQQHDPRLVRQTESPDGVDDGVDGAAGVTGQLGRPGDRRAAQAVGLGRDVAAVGGDDHLLDARFAGRPDGPLDEALTTHGPEVLARQPARPCPRRDDGDHGRPAAQRVSRRRRRSS
jgi:hypothetical protein